MPLDFSKIVLGAFVSHFAWLIPAVLAVAALKGLGPWLFGWLGGVQIGSRLRSLFPRVLVDLILPDDRGGLIQIDHLALTPTGLLVIATKTHSASIIGTVNEPI